LSARWVCCPRCGAVAAVERVGSVGEAGVADSTIFHCRFCGKEFSVRGGETVAEGLRSKGL